MLTICSNSIAWWSTIAARVEDPGFYLVSLKKLWKALMMRLNLFWDILDFWYWSKTIIVSYSASLFPKVLMRYCVDTRILLKHVIHMFNSEWPWSLWERWVHCKYQYGEIGQHRNLRKEFLKFRGRGSTQTWAMNFWSLEGGHRNLRNEFLKFEGGSTETWETNLWGLKGGSRETSEMSND